MFKKVSVFFRDSFVFSNPDEEQSCRPSGRVKNSSRYPSDFSGIVRQRLYSYNCYNSDRSSVRVVKYNSVVLYNFSYALLVLAKIVVLVFSVFSVREN